MRKFAISTARIRMAFPAILFLASARITHRSMKMTMLKSMNSAAARLPDKRELSHGDRQFLDDLSSVIPAVARHMPFRSDCMIQAIAGQRMLVRRNLASVIVIGARRVNAGEIAAHAWLKRGEEILLGGEVLQYTAIFDPEECEGS